MTPLLHGEADTQPAGGGSRVQTLPARGREKAGVLVSPGAYPLPTTHVPRHNQSEFLEKPIRETSHLRYVCEAHTRVPRHALQSERSDSINPQQPPTLLSVRFACPHRACGTTHSTQAPTGERPLFVTDHRVQVLRGQRMWTLGGPEKPDRSSLGTGRGGAKRRIGNEGAIPGCARLNIRASPSCCPRPPHTPALTRTDRKRK
ncbi:unnamed protein product [Rangifer tarandus platyrhynchus]|uniref:Uncharacterized protein n=1 Tax=Rangifer tarandus platyrhynchus TaxID=3082113 RepID=A0AC60A180_RANTA